MEGGAGEAVGRKKDQRQYPDNIRCLSTVNRPLMGPEQCFKLESCLDGIMCSFQGVHTSNPRLYASQLNFVSSSRTPIKLEMTTFSKHSIPRPLNQTTAPENYVGEPRKHERKKKTDTGHGSVSRVQNSKANPW